MKNAEVNMAMGKLAKVIHSNKSNPKKIYTKRRPDLVRRAYKEDSETRHIIELLLETIKNGLGLKISRTVLIKLGIRSYLDHIVELVGKSMDGEDVSELIMLEINKIRSIP